MLTLESVLQRKTLVLILFLCTAFFVFRKSTHAPPVEEDHFFMKERAAASSEWDFFVRALSFNRTRVIAPGDYYLFRPAMTGMLALCDILFRENRWAIGALSLFLHGLLGFVLFLLCAAYVERWKALLLSTVFLVQYSGMDMLLYRHISFYIMAQIFLGLGAFCLLRHEGEKKQTYLIAAAACFLVSGFFHEIIVLILPLVAAFTWRRNTLSPKETALVFVAPSVLYLLVNVLSILSYLPPSFFGPSDRGLSVLSVDNVLSVLLLAQGVFTKAFLTPFLHPLFESETGKIVLQIPPQTYPLLSFVGIVSLIALGLVGRFWWKQPSLKHGTVPLVFLSYWSIALLAMTTGRILQRGWIYLQSSTYYCYLFSFLFLFLTATLWPFLKRRGQIAVCAWAIATIVFSYFAVQNTLEPRKEIRAAVSQSIRRLSTALDSLPGHCWGGVLGNKMGEGPLSELTHSLDTLFYRRSCALHKRTPVFLVKQQGRFQLVELPLNLPKAIKAEKSLIKPHGFLSTRSINPLLMDFTLDSPTGGGILLAYQNPSNFVSLSYDSSYFFQLEMKSGNQEKHYPLGKLPFSGVLKLQVAQIDGVMSFIANGVNLSNVVTPTPWSGKIGAWSESALSNKPLFSGLVVSNETKETSAKIFRPLREVSLPR